MLKHEKLAVEHARSLGFDIGRIEFRKSGHKVLHVMYRGRRGKISLPSSPKNFDESVKLSRRNLEKLHDRLSK